MTDGRIWAIKGVSDRTRDAALGRIAERLALLEEKKVGQRTGPPSVRTRTQGKHPRGPRLRLPDT